MPIHETAMGINRHCLDSMNHAFDLGLSNATLNPLTTVAGLRTAVGNLAPAGSNENTIAEVRHIQQNIDAAQAAGILTDTIVAASDTQALLQAVFTGNDPSLLAADRRTFAFRG